MNINDLLSQLTLEEKAALLSGTDFMFTNPIPRLGIPSIFLSDGPHGLRVQKDARDNGVSESEPATCFPTAVTTASGWNPENAYKMGQAIAEEALHYGVGVVLGPGACIKRNPLCGRNFEYFSEDPLLAGKLGAAEVQGIQSKGVGTSVKHFALNNAENYRFNGNSICDMRAIREIYLKVFEIIVKEGKPDTMMCAYNQINGEYCCQNHWLLTDILRQEWGFDGLVMSDWGATHDRVKGIQAGLDLEMPGDTAICRKWIIDAVNNGTLSEEDLNKAVANVLRLVERYKDNPKGGKVDWKAHNDLAAEIAEDCAVLLKNDGSLPLRKTERILVVGDLFDKMRYQGAGSSMINPTYLTTPRTEFDRNQVNYAFARGYKENSLSPDETLIAEALEKAKDFKTVCVFAGLTDYVESEGCDRATMGLPENQLALIDALLQSGKRIVVVLYGGSPMELPFADKVNAILNMYLPGQNGGKATFDLLYGIHTPSGKLAETWVKSYDDVPFGKEYSKSIHEVYKESIYVGYRYYLTASKEVRYPFGYGLSYTTFEYADMKVEENENEFRVSFHIRNTGEFDGAEIAQLYVQSPKGVHKPLRELKGFAKVYLKPGESKRVEITVPKADLRYWNTACNSWVLEGGEYILQIASDSQTIQLSRSVMLPKEEAANPYSERVEEKYSTCRLDIDDALFEEMSGLIIPPLPSKKPIWMESRFSDLKEVSLMGKILFSAVLGVAKNDMRKAKKLPEGTERDNKIKGAMFLKRILESNSLITMSMSAAKSCPYNFAEGFIHFSNGHLIKGIKSFCTKIKVPKLPKDKEEN
ncbi:MAG: glycoside hydrolase family 3 C-terminal domain-containing protein [Candidatus Enteromonas sp.]|nr:glycoside hydrolase family 3 C-terminal domain-containing protein [Candidatus Enteromonas sp.]